MLIIPKQSTVMVFPIPPPTVAPTAPPFLVRTRKGAKLGGQEGRKVRHCFVWRLKGCDQDGSSKTAPTARHGSVACSCVRRPGTDGELHQLRLLRNTCVPWHANGGIKAKQMPEDQAEVQYIVETH